MPHRDQRTLPVVPTARWARRTRRSGVFRPGAGAGGTGLNVNGPVGLSVCQRRSDMRVDVRPNRVVSKSATRSHTGGRWVKKLAVAAGDAGSPGADAALCFARAGGERRDDGNRPDAAAEGRAAADGEAAVVAGTGGVASACSFCRRCHCVMYAMSAWMAPSSM